MRQQRLRTSVTVSFQVLDLVTNTDVTKRDLGWKIARARGERKFDAAEAEKLSPRLLQPTTKERA